MAVLRKRRGQRPGTRKRVPRLGLDGLVGALSGFRAGLKQRGLGQVFGIRGTKRLGVTVVGRRQLHFLGREQQGFRIVQRRFNAMSGKNAAFARLGRRNRDCTCRRHACLDKRRDALGWGDGTARMNDDQRRRRQRKDLAQRVLDGTDRAPHDGIRGRPIRDEDLFLALRTTGYERHEFDSARA